MTTRTARCHRCPGPCCVPRGGCRLGRSSSQPHTPEAAPQLWEAGGGEHAALREAPAPHWVPRRFQLCPADLREHLEHPRARPERCWAAAGSGRCGEELQQSFVVVLVTQQADGGEFLVFQCAGLVRRSPSTSRPLQCCPQRRRTGGPWRLQGQ